ncbi:Hypothetical Protein FCC1311_065422 [Hondaea fermentalgiana]|uniref:Uncharacterized protein n=1 Tax=Hondaea fermentalgiana TaxID=2315210 RepID=A0A2R5GNW5_9STRA|nr:Hypothetical Protein FCC1311_065422 [Hondaea fermentalgiana]|eukprot:GBG30323.1 Hypothetical Protein FCC1311_065422 [Hondaea fermentalgiana]
MMNELEAQQGKLAEPDERDRQAVADFHRLVTVMQSSAVFENLAGKPIGEWIGVQDQENDRLVFLRQRSLLDLPRGDAFQDISVVLRLDTFKVEVFRFAQTLKIPDFPTQARTREDLIDVLSRASKLMICQGDGFSHPQYAMKKAETFGEMPEACQTRLHDLTCGQRIVVGGGFTGNTVSRAVEMGMNPATGGSAHLVRSKNCQLAFDPVSKRARRCGPCQKMLKKLSVDEKSLQETVTSQRVSKFTPVNSMSRQELKLRVLELSGEKKVMQRKRPKLSSNADMMIPNPNADEVDSTKDEHHLGHEGHLHHAVPTLHSHHAPAHQPPHAQHVGHMGTIKRANGGTSARKPIFLRNTATATEMDWPEPIILRSFF